VATSEDFDDWDIEDRDDSENDSCAVTHGRWERGIVDFIGFHDFEWAGSEGIVSFALYRSDG